MGVPELSSASPDLPFRWLGGRLCLDYANTVAWSAGSDPAAPAVERPEYERFTEYARLVGWGQAAGTLSDGEAETLLLQRAEHPAVARAALYDAVVLRAALHGMFVDLIGGRVADPSALATLNAMVARSLSHRRLVPAGKGLAWTWTSDEADLDRPLWPVALSAADLLVSDDLYRVRQCAGDDCGFLFLDTGRGPGRRWCDMAHCGNRAKARRHYQRIHGVERDSVK
jgi:predicted RNA-binding Zn ribbon-like protein